MIAWLLSAVSLVLAFGTAILAPGLWRAWTQREPEALGPPAPQPQPRQTMPTFPPGLTMAEASRALQGHPAVAPDVVLCSRGCELVRRLAADGRVSQANVVAAATRLRDMDGEGVVPHLVYRSQLIALLREHGVSTSPDSQS